MSFLKPIYQKRLSIHKVLFLFLFPFLTLLTLIFNPDITYPEQIQSTSIIHIYVFSSKDCERCEAVEKKNIFSLAEKNNCKIEVKYFDIDNIENYQLLTELEEKYQDTDNELPVVFIGEDVLGGEKEVEENLEKLIIKYKEKGGCPWPEEVSFEKISKIKSEGIKEEKEICLAFFFEFGCKQCQRVFHLINYIEQKYPDVRIKRFNLTEEKNKILNEAISEKYNVPEEKRLLPTTLFIGSEYLHEKEITLKNIEKKIAEYAETGTVCPWDIKEDEVISARKNVIERFKSFGPFTVAFAGLIDGINPCAFTTIVFFISYLALMGSKRKELLLLGASFTFAVFLTYFLIGCGAFIFIQRLTIYSLFSRILNIGVASLAIVLGIFSLNDFFKARKGKLKEIKLQLPSFLKRRIHLTISREMRFRRHILAALITGFIVSLLELACTGQVYLPTIVFVSSQEGMRRCGFSYLLLYNLMFVIPLIIVFLISYLGTTSEQLAKFTRKHIATVKLLTALFFFIIGALLIMTAI